MGWTIYINAINEIYMVSENNSNQWLFRLIPLIHAILLAHLILPVMLYLNKHKLCEVIRICVGVKCCWLLMIYYNSIHYRSFVIQPLKLCKPCYIHLNVTSKCIWNGCNLARSSWSPSVTLTSVAIKPNVDLTNDLTQHAGVSINTLCLYTPPCLGSF